MNTILLITIVLLVAACLLIIIFRRNKIYGPITPITPRLMGHESNHAPEKGHEFWCDLAIIDDNGVMILESKEIEKIPARAHRVESSSSAIKRVSHLASDLFKGSASIPNKTVEVIFKPEVHQGLANGTYTLMRTKTGDVLADSIDSSGTIVGKGRLIQGGNVKQLASGAFQLVSIAVAQSHLADIERSLSAITDSISEVLEGQENEDRARIKGPIDYLSGISAHMKDLRCPDELPQQKRNAIESIIKDSHSWRNKLEEDMDSLIRQISSLSDLDKYGTGDTFKRLESLIERLRPLLERRKLFLDLASAINFVTVYLDPTQREFSKIDVNNARWADYIEKFKGAVDDKESKLMGKAFWNSNNTLQQRRDILRFSSSYYQQTAINQQAAYLTLESSLERSMSRLIDPSGNVHVAISFDGHGDVDGAAIL